MSRAKPKTPIATPPKPPAVDLGLGRLDDFAPRPRRAPPRSERAAVDEAAREQGFGKPAMPAQKPRRARRSGEARHQIFVHGPTSVIDRFMRYCDEQRLSYWEALDRFLKSENK